MSSLGKDFEFYLRKSAEKGEQLLKKISNINEIFKNTSEFYSKTKISDSKIEKSNLFMKGFNDLLRDLLAKIETEYEISLEKFFYEFCDDGKESTIKLITKTVCNDSKPEGSVVKSKKSKKGSIQSKTNSLKKSKKSETVSLSPEPQEAYENIDFKKNNHRIKMWDLNFPMKSEHNAYITHICSPTLFWVQLSEITKTLNSLSKSLNKYYSKTEKSHITNPQVKSFCAARFSIDKYWYRAQIIKFNRSENTVLVFYIDYGNTETIPVTEIRDLIDKFYATPILAIPFSLAHAYPTGDDWTASDIAEFRKFVLNNEIKLQMKSVYSGWPIYFCRISVNNNDLLDSLISQKCAKQASSEAIVNKYKKYLDKEKCLIRMVDINEDVSVRGLSPGINDSTKIPDSKTNFLFDTPPTKAQVDVDLVKVEDKPPEPQVIPHKPEVVNIATRVNSRRLKFTAASDIECSIVHIINPSEFYICLANEDFGMYDKMDCDLQEYYTKHHALHSFKFTNTEQNISVCVVKSPSKGKYYRGYIKAKQITNKTDVSFTVRLLDFGEYEKIPSKYVYEMVDTFSDVPAFSIKVSLDYIKPISSINNVTVKENEWSAAATKFFSQKLIENQFLYFTIYNSPREIDCKFEYTLRVILKAELDKDDNHRVTINDELIRYGWAEGINGELNEKKQLLPRLGCEEAEVEEYRLERIYKYLDDCGSSKSWDYENEADGEPKEDTRLEDDFAPILKVVGLPATANVDDNYVKDEDELQNENDYGNNHLEDQNEGQIENVDQKNAKQISIQQNEDVTDGLNENDVVEKPVGESALQVDNTNVLLPINNIVPPKPEEVALVSRNASNGFENVERVNGHQSDSDNDLNNLMNNWDPRVEHFESARNLYAYDEDDTDNIVYGYKKEEIENACRAYQRNGVCHRRNCRFIHTDLKYKPKKTYRSVFDDALTFPVFTTEVYTVFIKNFLSNTTFDCYMYYRLGTKECKNPEWLTVLTQRMNTFYTKNKHLPQKSLEPFYIGEIVAAHNRQAKCWCRAKIVNVEDSDYENVKYYVEYLDFPIKEIVHIRDLNPIKETFLNFKANLKTCELFGVDTNDDCDFDENSNLKESLGYLQKLLENHKSFSLFAVITNCATDTLEVILYLDLNQENEPICINDYLISNNHHEFKALIQSLLL